MRITMRPTKGTYFYDSLLVFSARQTDWQSNMTPDSMLWFQELIVISQDSFDVQFSKVLTRKKFVSLALR